MMGNRNVIVNQESYTVSIAFKTFFKVCSNIVSRHSPDANNLPISRNVLVLRIERAVSGDAAHAETEREKDLTNSSDPDILVSENGPGRRSGGVHPNCYVLLRHSEIYHDTVSRSFLERTCRIYLSLCHMSVFDCVPSYSSGTPGT